MHFQARPDVCTFRLPVADITRERASRLNLPVAVSGHPIMPLARQTR
jgi:hypothetical protein